MNAATLSGPRADKSMTPAMRASRMLGWVSFAIGAAELIAPKKVAKAAGMNENRTGLLRAYGVRELVAGVGSHSVYPVPALWSRVAGDVLDIATVAMSADRNEQGRRNRNNWIAIAVLAGVTVLDALVASRMAAETKEGKGEVPDYSSRSGFPQGATAARGAGVVTGAFEGKAGGAAAGDSSPAGLQPTGRSSTDLNGAAGGGGASTTGVSATQTSTGASSTGGGSGGPGGSGAASGAGSAGQSGSTLGQSSQTMPKESQAAVPQAVGYTPV